MYCLRPRKAEPLVDTLDEELRRADPAAGLRRDDATALITAMASGLPSQPAWKGRWWKNWRITVPIGVVSVLALTGAAIAAPLVLAVGEPDNWVEIDARIPITYETDSGVSVSCVYGLYVTSAAGRTAEDERLGEFLAKADWTGIGQEIYDYAIANPVTPQEGEVWSNDSPEVRDAISFKLAVTPVITDHVPADLLSNGSGWSSTDTCTGPFR